MTSLMATQLNSNVQDEISCPSVEFYAPRTWIAHHWMWKQLRAGGNDFKGHLTTFFDEANTLHTETKDHIGAAANRKPHFLTNESQ